MAETSVIVSMKGLDGEDCFQGFELEDEIVCCTVIHLCFFFIGLEHGAANTVNKESTVYRLVFSVSGDLFVE